MNKNWANFKVIITRHKEVFAEYILPQTTEPKVDWDNHADESRGVVSSVDACRGICEQETLCLQYAYDQERNCLVTGRSNLGEAATGMQSGWIRERMQLFHDKTEPCEGEKWIV